MWRTVRQLLEMIRFSHTIFALPFALLAAVLAWNVPWPEGEPIGFGAAQFVGILLCMVCARSAAMAFNRVVDREIDAANPRTAGRHLPAGKIRVSSAIAFAGLMSLAFVASTLLFLPNRLPLFLALPVLAFLLMYSFSKRWTALAHFWLGAALMLAPVCTWIALRGSAVEADPSDLIPSLVLGTAVLFWVAGFDIIYACQDHAFDREAGLRSVPAALGIGRALRVAAVCHVVMLAMLVLLPLSDWLGGPALPLGWIYGATVAVIGVLLACEHAMVRPTDLSRVNIAFFYLNAVISAALLVFGAIDVLGG